ncbi:MAG: HAD family hydrolase [Lachnospiraceae bacterium]|jgi:HAD superfamily hydrolase (TIGR01549 family)|nr:HAD family hydrolase [Lachnospiraceae bacterium]
MILINNILESEMYLNDIQAVIFDLDDTLYSEKSYVRSGFKKIAEFFEKPSMEDELWNVFIKGGKPIDEILKLEGLLDFKEKSLEIYRFQVPDIKLYYGVPELIKRIQKEKRVGIITDGRPEGQYAKIRALGLNVDELIITDELGGIEFRKPNEMAFRLMKMKMDVPYEKMVYIGDNIKKDFIAPKKLGMRSIWFKNPDGLY